MGNLTGRKALVTGGARGLGAGMAQALAAAGASVMIGDVLEALGQETAADLAGRAQVGFVQLDVTKDDELGVPLRATVERARRLRHPGQQRRHRDHGAGGRPRGRRTCAACSTSTSSAPRSA